MLENFLDESNRVNPILGSVEAERYRKCLAGENNYDECIVQLYDSHVFYCIA